MKERIILFTRFPIPGTTKTRLIPAIGREAAARLQETMTGHAVLQARCCSGSRNAQIEIRFEGGNSRSLRNWLGDGLRFTPQGAGNLGQRMERAFRNAFDEGIERVVIIGCDCPDINVEYLNEAFSRLDNSDLVIGPAVDGGYYLNALRKPAPELFEGIDWGSEVVLEQTISAAQTCGLQTEYLAILSDVDRPEDLQLGTVKELLKTEDHTISVVIPSLNEESCIVETVDRARKEVMEVILADGGSSDQTVSLARQAGADVIRVPRGRAVQLNTAVVKTKGSILLFLHADTHLPIGFAAKIIDAMRQPGVIAGAFRLGIDGNGAGIRIVERCANIRSRLFQFPYGDQALFMKRSTFIRLGGFANFPIMEDFELVKRLRLRGRIITLNQRINTSARRWRQCGMLRTTMINQLMIAGYRMGVDPDCLARFYRNQKRRRKT